ncbi:ABC transporter ATP-binding protein [Nitratireductor basaltis]|uniref:ABC transporter n=1 Tax=Nitratireductor basaltis TaxID=472175 RepID=A0A084U545_9HYPH|nr:ATP-binding cassette domain-containing protein [Nitratireductor basaltis]KFB08081.1 ABC transporter [Nitratireductor basaltis]
MAEPALELSDIAFQWPGEGGFALHVRKLRVPAGEKVLLLGASGSGKSTLLSLIGGILNPRDGSVRVAGTTLSDLSIRHRDRFRAETIGIIFQQFNLLPYASVADNIALPLRFAPARRARTGNIAASIDRLCNGLCLPKGIETQTAGLLSVGQQQRVAVARALIGTPPLVLADEPTSALDTRSQAQFLDLLFQQVASAGSALLMVSHEEGLAPSFDRVVHLDEVIGKQEAR